jgi:hypothetical protein
MPMVYQEPKVFFEYDGAKIYHDYDDEGRQRFYWYSTDFHEDSHFRFDIRDLQKRIVEGGERGSKGIGKLDLEKNSRHHKRVLAFAIEHEMLEFPEGS